MCRRIADPLAAGPFAGSDAGPPASTGRLGVDDVVLRAIAKWPDVPAVFGWLALDRRGTWLLRNERIENPSVLAFINRNYAHDDRGRWFFQNGPQRVYVSLEYTPLIYRVHAEADGMIAIETQAGTRVDSLQSAWLDDDGNLLLESKRGIGAVHDHDLQYLLPRFCNEQGSRLGEDELSAVVEARSPGRDLRLWLKFGDELVRVGSISGSEVPQRFGFAREPAAAPGEGACA
jgi:hypothetical protein